MLFHNPFAASSAKPGHGSIVVELLPPSTPTLQALSYQYPLKLIAPNPTAIEGRLVYTVFILSYGGGLVAGDSIHLNVRLDSTARLVLLTQGSTKIFNTPDAKVLTVQETHVSIAPDAALCYLPDPVQPFARSSFSQTQIYVLESLEQSNLCVCDWVCEGRSARGERWNFHTYTSKNEVWLESVASAGLLKKRLLLRDTLILEDDGKISNGLSERVDGHGVYGTLILRGPLFKSLGDYFLMEFEQLPRIGNKKWDDDDLTKLNDRELARLARQKQETHDRVIWTAANVRGFVLVKFGAREVEGAKRWLHTLLQDEGSVERNFGEGSLLCLR